MKVSSFFVSLFLLCLCTTSYSQIHNNTLQTYLETQKTRLGLTKEDITSFKISDSYETNHNGVHHIYLNQQYRGIPVYNAILAIHIDKKGAYHMTRSRFISGLKSRIVGEQPKISALEAVSKAVEYLGIPNAIIPKKVISQREDGAIILEKTNFSNSPVKVTQIYTPAKDGKVYLTWDLRIDRKDNADNISLRINALTGGITDVYNQTVYCNTARIRSLKNRERRTPLLHKYSSTRTTAPLARGTYRVIPLPGESPLHAPFSLVQNPADETASPLGWHDNKSTKFTITQGNNVHAYVDEFDQDSPSTREPDGGTGLIFDFPYDSTKSSQSKENRFAAVTNLFYMNNMMHDILYGFGFDEKAGNFQDYNFGKGGEGNDHVEAQAQDGGGRNNANFFSPEDGANPRMQMYLWDGSTGGVFNVVQDDGTTWALKVVPAAFGGNIPTPPIEGEAQEANDHSIHPTRACEEPLDDMKGKVAIIDRGTCEFGLKSLNAQNAGAIAVLICGFDNSRVSMGGGAVGSQVTIPAFYAPRDECAKLRVLINGDNKFKLKIGKEEVQDSVIYDGDFDNGVIAHEYGHGITNRLTGGPSRGGCLANGESMSEGWSDFFTLALTHRVGDKGTDKRGIGNFVTSQAIDGNGIRTKPYSTDFSINDFTYSKARTLSVPHGVGSVWCMMIWEMYWAFVDEYGFDPDLSNKTSGNAQAIQLVIDGLKLQPCSPGFVDGRDAILLADTLNNGGVNSCLIWKAFAKRGLGYGADQGSSDAVGDPDEKESFDLPPLCQNSLRIWKHMTELINAGEPIEVTINVANNVRDTSRNVMIRDIIPAKTSYKTSSASIAPAIHGDTLVWTFNQMLPLEQKEITYTLLTDGKNKSVLHWEEKIEDDLEVFDKTWKDISVKGLNVWDVTDEYTHEGPWAFYIYSDPEENDQHLFLRKGLKLTQEQPVIRFYHWYNLAINSGNPAVGTVELSVNDEPYTLAKDLFIKNGFTGLIPYGVFVEPFYEGFYGKSDGFIQSYIDLSQYRGKDLKLKFRFGNENLDNTLAEGKPYGWVIDDIQLIDLKNYNSEVCISADGRAEHCVAAPGKGSLVEVGTRVGTDDPKKKDSQWSIYPNPAKDFAVMKWSDESLTSGDILISHNDKLVFEARKVPFNAPYLLDIHNWVAGVYIVKVKSSGHRFVKKLIIVK